MQINIFFGVFQTFNIHTGSLKMTRTKAQSFLIVFPHFWFKYRIRNLSSKQSKNHKTFWTWFSMFHESNFLKNPIWYSMNVKPLKTACETRHKHIATLTLNQFQSTQTKHTPVAYFVWIKFFFRKVSRKKGEIEL